MVDNRGRDKRIGTVTELALITGIYVSRAFSSRLRTVMTGDTAVDNARVIEIDRRYPSCSDMAHITL